MKEADDPDMRAGVDSIEGVAVGREDFDGGGGTVARDLVRGVERAVGDADGVERNRSH